MLVSVQTKEKEYVMEQPNIRVDIQNGILWVEVDESMYDGDDELGTIKITEYDHTNGNVDYEYRNVFSIGLSEITQILVEESVD